MKFRFTPIATAVGFTAGMLVSGGAFADTIKIAIAGPFTGPVTQYGDMVKQGVDTAIEQLNAGGGILGNTFEAVQIDDGCEPKQGPVVANRVVNDEIHYVVGHVCSGATIAATDIYNNEGVVMVTPSATSPAVTDGKNYEFIFPPPPSSLPKKSSPRRLPCCTTSSHTARA
jgi:branched-chain amino acid transport system substrate-binding protein